MRWNEEFGIFDVTSFDEASQILRGDGWSSDPRNNPTAPPQFAALPLGNLLFMDPPDHTVLRRFLSPAFTPRAIESLRPRVVSVIEAALDRFEDEGDLLADFGYLVPLAVISELLDVGAAGAELFREQTPHLVKLLELDASADDLGAAAAATFEIMMFLAPLIGRREQEPGADFISGLLTGELSLEEITSTCVLLLAAGHETTANLIGNGAYALMKDPAQLPALTADPAAAIEELIRFHSPVRLIGRTALRRQSVGGREVLPGQAVFLRVAEANRDPERFADPDRLDLTRKGPGHLGFGGGAHFCIGAALARLEASEALPRLFARFPTIKIAEEPEWRESMTFGGLRSLRVRT
ncbi:cytochrome P450 [Actinocorallia lasiicapitis]